jgi:tRNA threonylcarbamoyladenosine modification (KEOPS) complex  Pcc1 subunit
LQSKTPAANAPLRMITAIFVYEHPQALSIVDALQPDNTPEIEMKATGNRLEITVKTNKLRTLVASCDDLLSNLQIAQDILIGF